MRFHAKPMLKKQLFQTWATWRL